MTPNLVAVGRTMWALARVPKHMGTPGTRPLGMGRGDPLETCFSPICLKVPIAVILRETAGA